MLTSKTYKLPMNQSDLKIDESVGINFLVNNLIEARDLTLNIINEARKYLKPGITENELTEKISEIQLKYGVEGSWHKPQIRFGKNTIQPFGLPGIKNNTLQEHDIAFMDLGLIYKNHEGDVGRTFFIGSNERMKKCCHDVELIWNKTKNHWLETSSTGEELYNFAESLANNLGWKLARKKANGHRISDFPHIVKNRRVTIDELPIKPKENRWILEIQILENDESFGAFFEDLL